MAFPYPMTGIVYDTNGTTVLASVRVSARNERTNKTLSINTDSLGVYVIDAANFTDGYSNGDTITLSVIYTNLERQIEHIIDTSRGGGSGLDLTLIEVPASDALRYFTVQDFYDFHNLTAIQEDAPTATDVVKVGSMVEEEIDNMCSTRFSDGTIETEVDDCDATTGWSGSTDAVAVAVSTDDADYRTKTGALDLGKSGTTQAFFQYEKSSLTSRDFRNKYIALWVKIDSLTGLRTVDNGSAIQLRYGSSSTDYYEKTYYFNELVTGWNLLFFKSDDREVTETGSANDGAMTYFRLRFDTAASSTTFTAGTIVMDNIFLVHRDHFIDEYIDVKHDPQWDYYIAKRPIDRMVRFLVNRAEEGNAASWDELTEKDNELKIDFNTGRVRVADVTSATDDLTSIFPTPGAQHVRATYIFGKTTVPRDIKKLAILMTSKDLMKSNMAKALFGGRSESRAVADSFGIWDTQIEMILSRYRNLDMVMV